MDDWKKNLDAHFKQVKKTKKEIKTHQDELKGIAKAFFQDEVLPAFEALAKELKKHKRVAEVDAHKWQAALVVKKGKHKEFVYEVTLTQDGDSLLVSKSVYAPNEKGKLKLGVEGKIRNAAKSLQINRISQADIIADFLAAYTEATRLKGR